MDTKDAKANADAKADSVPVAPSVPKPLSSPIGPSVPPKTLRPRGLLVAVEGVRYTGKTTLIKALTHYLSKSGSRFKKVAYWAYPDATTPIGRVLDSDATRYPDLYRNIDAIYYLGACERQASVRNIQIELCRNDLVILESYLDTPRARCLSAWAQKKIPQDTHDIVHDILSQCPQPNLTLYLGPELDQDTGLYGPEASVPIVPAAPTAKGAPKNAIRGHSTFSFSINPTGLAQSPKTSPHASPHASPTITRSTSIALDFASVLDLTETRAKNVTPHRIYDRYQTYWRLDAYNTMYKDVVNRADVEFIFPGHHADYQIKRAVELIEHEASTHERTRIVSGR